MTRVLRLAMEGGSTRENGAKKDEAPGGSFSFRTALHLFLILRKFSDFSCSRRSLLSACRFTSSYLGD